MTKLKTLIAIGCTVIATLQPAQAAEKLAQAEWKVRMQAMLSDVLQLIPYVFSDRRFQEQKNHVDIKRALDSLATNSAKLKDHTAKFRLQPGGKIDPSLRFIAESFENEIAAAQTSFQGSDQAKRQAQVYLRSAVAKCSICHSQTAAGPGLRLDQFRAQFDSLNSADRFVAFVATRQFDDALAAFSKSLATPKTSANDELNVDRTAKSALAIAVRVKKDPKLTLKLIEDLAASGLASKMLQNDLSDWRASALSWQAATAPSSNNEREIFSEAQKLFEIGQKKESSLGHFQNSNVTMLRASSLLHDLLSNFPNSSKRAEAYLMLAQTYELLPGFTVWDLPDEYLAACIRENPHSEMSERCFTKYESSIVMGYSGSSGTNVPSAIQDHVDRMKTLARRKKP